MTDHQIETQIKNLIRVERQTTTDILKLINLAERRDLPLRRGFASTFDWLTKGLGYSGAAAFRRLQSARLMRAVPDIERKLETGDVNLTTLSHVSKSIRTSEKVTGQKISAERKTEIVNAVTNQSSHEAEATLLALLPETASTVHEERSRSIDANNTRLSFNLDKDAMADLAWVTDFLSHVVPDGSHGKVMANVLKKFRQMMEKRKSVKAERARCEYKDEQTGHQCGQTFMIERDHVWPKALGGKDEASNRRPLCRGHNQLMARELLGSNWANAYRRKVHFRRGNETGASPADVIGSSGAGPVRQPPTRARRAHVRR